MSGEQQGQHVDRSKCDFAKVMANQLKPNLVAIAVNRLETAGFTLQDTGFFDEHDNPIDINMMPDSSGIFRAKIKSIYDEAKIEASLLDEVGGKDSHGVDYKTVVTENLEQSDAWKDPAFTGPIGITHVDGTLLLVNRIPHYVDDLDASPQYDAYVTKIRMQSSVSGNETVESTNANTRSVFNSLRTDFESLTQPYREQMLGWKNSKEAWLKSK